MSDKEFVGVIIACLLTMFVGILIGTSASSSGWEDEAVEKGHAEYYIDGEHEKKWRWMTRADEINAAEPKGEPDPEGGRGK